MYLATVERVLAENERGLAWLARRTEIPYWRLYRLKRGECDDLRRAEARAIARALNVPEDHLFAGVLVYPDDPRANVVGRRVRPRRRRSAA